MRLDAHASTRHRDDAALDRLTCPKRLAALEATGLLNGGASDVLDRIARLVTRLVGVPIGVVSLVSDSGQHFPGLAGLSGWAGEGRGTPLTHSYCQYVVGTDRPFVISDAHASESTRSHPATTELGVVAYAGVPLRTCDGITLGALCGINTSPECWTTDQLQTLEELAAITMSEIELRATSHALLKANRRLMDQVVTDPVTSLPNRQGFTHRAGQLLAVAQREQHPLLVCAVNLIGFRHINERLGYDAGDGALLEVAALLEGALRPEDVVARMGSDEFIAVISHASESDIPFITTRLAAAFDVYNGARNRLHSLDARVGFAAWDPQAPVSLTRLLQRAEASMRDMRALSAT